MSSHKKKTSKRSNKIENQSALDLLFTPLYQSKIFGIAIIKSDGTVLGCNHLLNQMLKRDAESLINKNFFEILAPIDKSLTRHKMKIIQSNEKIEFHYESNVSKDTKANKRADIYLFADKKIEKEKIFAIVTIKDRSGHSQTEINLRKAYNQLKEAERVAHLGHWDWDLVRDNLIWSDEMCRIMGFSPHEFIPSYYRFLDAVHEEDREELKKKVKEAIDGLGDYQIENRIIQPDGNIRFLQTQGEVTFDQEERPIRMFGTSLDITDRKLAEIEIQKLNTKLEKRLIERQFILDNVSDGIMFINNKGVLLFINKVAQRIMGIVNRDDILGKNIEGLNLASYGIHKCLSGFQYTNKRIDFIIGKDRYLYLVTGRPIKDTKGEIIGALEVMTDVKEVTSMVRAVADPLYTAFATIIGKSKKIRDVITKAQLISKTDYLVLIQGESGTGKDLFANSIHIESGRKGLFIPINCAALPEQLLESELFGYNRGAFTGAEKNGKPGLFKNAQDGTIFLDEIAEMPLPLQAKLLRVIQENKIRRIGSKREIRVNVRIIAATNRNLSQMVLKNQFRQDLYYRINVYPLVIPSLRERKEDIPELAISFLMRANTILNKKIESISSRATTKLMAHHWPGNIRELQNVIKRAAIFCEGSRIRQAHINLDNGLSQTCAFAFGNTEWAPEAGTMKEVVGQFEKAFLEQQLKNYRSIRQAAAVLGLSHTSLIRKIRKYGIKYNR